MRGLYAQSSPQLTVAWAESGDLFVWRDGETRQIASDGVIQPYFAPDGQHIAFTRGPQGVAASLWVVSSDGSGEQELVEPDTAPDVRGGHHEINQVVSLDNQTIYFNTRQRYQDGWVNDDNLYRVELGGEPRLILPRGAGGDFAVSPSGQWIVVVHPGEYDFQKGRVSLLDPLGARVREIFTFTALLTLADAPYYPLLDWSADSAYARVPIPDNESRRVTLWRVPVEGSARIFGYTDGLPRWSVASGHIIYLKATIEAEVYDLMIADENGENPQVYTSGKLSDPRWLPNGEAFVYTENGYFWLGRRGEAPYQLLATSAPVFAGDWYVFATAEELRYAALDAEHSISLTRFSTVPTYTAVVLP